MEKYGFLLKDRPKAAGRKVWDLSGRAAGSALILFLAAMTGGCLVGNDEYDDARMKRDEYRGEIKELHESNDVLKREIAQAYESCDLISAQLSVTAAMSIHDKFTDGLGRPRPVLPPPISQESGRPAAQRPSTQRPAAQRPSTQRPPTAQRPPAQRPPVSNPEPSRPVPPVTPPPPTTGGGGAIDWGD